MTGGNKTYQPLGVVDVMVRGLRSGVKRTRLVRSVRQEILGGVNMMRMGEMGSVILR